ncbi:DNA repair protein RadC [Bordetella ansorpii]|jgi:DNA repair protein RadC|uniref:DNA repair protein RadC n=1 Tax=Bordetella ansorpii TaxID=288768 RepID=A0A157RJW5_9BORD|nr:DNA repair protein RadC [Bordetella ansorpii]SAI57669.1 DNA repair protein RadC [Bordetella ansorpii]
MKLSESMPEHERPRERLLRQGAASLHDSELLAVALRTGAPGVNAVELGRRLMGRFGGLRGLFAATPAELCREPGLGAAKACALAAVLELARRAIEEDLVGRPSMNHPDNVKLYCRTALSHRTVEHCIALYLDNQLNLIAVGEVARGTLAQASVYPREVVREALRHHAAALILAHNHPSGLAQPSAADRELTRRLRQALALVDVRLVDHLIVAADQVVSMAQLGQM